ncbi:uncharacterized protein FOMMEDRAFT_150045 [Fomitiporia mediterranea MF3/22]|uniref:uncharacterized protein n=1 Tax=Fomitiporia mediterranea (strain MF3/22) TaxID=694068 RepID=UPI0004408A2F|nr:uncharacterized protein FOMMEDRAFT_150045 [Fomitiporia mediterranea MF3/22]EJD07512.1 hypothetical protein FOMMEDRAFT_150045 [Fomitiporia mediterranea MF3/22]
MPYFSSVRSELVQNPASNPRQRTSDDVAFRPPLPTFNHDESTLNNPGSLANESEKCSPEATLQPPAAPTSSGSAHSSRKNRRKGSRIEHGLRVHWDRFLRRVGGGVEDSTDSVVAESGEQDGAEVDSERRVTDADYEDEDTEDEKSVNEVVVDRSWGRSRTGSDSMSIDEDGPNKSSSDPHNPGSVDKGGTLGSDDLDSDARHSHRFWSCCLPLSMIKWQLWNSAVKFFSSPFHSQKSEERYRREIWFQSKPLALWSSLFFVINWVLGCALVPKPFTIADTIFYFAVAPVVTLPIPFLVMFDFARDRPYIYNTAVILSTWAWSVFQVVEIFLCGYYSGHSLYGLSCGTKDFLSLFYYTSALQTIALFGLKMNRFPATLGALVFLVMSASMVIPHRIGWIRNDLNFIFFQGFLLYIHYMKEVAERRLYELRDRLKIQFKATQMAQVNERKASESKRRLTSYVFHDKPRFFELYASTSFLEGVNMLAYDRSTLAQLVIAVQNMEAYRAIPKDQEVEFSALSGSLSMMSKVLNDVLDFNRMDSGLLESVSMPYAFHAVMRSMFVPLKLATDARNLHFDTELDNSIDIVARHAVWESLVAQDKLVIQDGIDTFEKDMEAHPDEDGVVVGDEMRLRQIVTNLVSNACKFTPAGGTLTVRTRLISPSLPQSSSDRYGLRSNGDASSTTANSRKRSCDVDLERGGYSGLSAHTLDQHNASHRKSSTLDKIIVRIEISDTGYGIKAKDIAKGKLFSAFNQTQQGRLQGGKGTGLGLALVRHIVSLSGGRLGVQSKVGVGSTFWVELPLGVGKKAAGGTTSSDPSSDRGGPSGIAGARPKPTPVQSMARSRPSSSSRTVSPARSHTHMGGSNSFGQASQASSALKGIMEQGGLVELGPSRITEGGCSIPTRSIGDPSTGTDTGSLAGDPPSPNDRESRNFQSTMRPMEGRGVSPTRRPSHVDIPRRPSFGHAKGSPPASAELTAENKSPRPVALDPPLRVLVVDDDQLTRKLMKRMLQRLGCTVSTAENGQIAFDLITGDGRTPGSDGGEVPGQTTASSTTPMQRNFEGPRYEIIFLDNQMPVLSGLDLVAKLRELRRKDFVVGVTGNALLSDQEEYQQAGVDYVITKPVYEINLKSMIALAAERRKNGEPSPRPDC